MLFIPSMASWMDWTHCISCRVSGHLSLLEKWHCKKVPIFIIPLQRLSRWLKIKQSLYSAKGFSVLLSAFPISKFQHRHRNASYKACKSPATTVTVELQTTAFTCACHLAGVPFLLNRNLPRGLATQAQTCAHTLSFLPHLWINIETSSVF